MSDGTEIIPFGEYKGQNIIKEVLMRKADLEEAGIKVWRLKQKTVVKKDHEATLVAGQAR